MFTFEKTSLYINIVKKLKTVLKAISNLENTVLRDALTGRIIEITRLTAEIVREKKKEKRSGLIKNCHEKIYGAASHLNITNLPPSKKTSLSEIFHKIHQEISDFPKTQKHVLLLTVKMGQGHINAAKATKEALQYLYGYDYNIEIIDFMDVISPAINKTTQKLLNSSSRYTPKFNQIFFDSTDKEWPIKLMSILNYPFLINKLKKMLEEKKPDLIISTFPAWDHLILEIWKKHEPLTRFINIITDSISIHTAWIFSRPDYHIVANQDTARVLKKMKVDPKKIKVLGLPIRLDFLKPAKHSEFCEKFNLNPHKKTILYLAISDHLKSVVENVNRLSRKKNYQILVVTGRDFKIAPKLKEKVSHDNVFVFGWIDNFSEFLKNSAIVITKAGGTIVMESIAMEKPLIVTHVLAGQEAGNAEFVEKHYLGVVLSKKNPDLTSALNQIEKDYRQIKKNLSSVSNPQAALKIARFINEEIFDAK